MKLDNIFAWFKAFGEGLVSLMVSLYNHFISIDDYLVKSNEENLSILLKTEEDKRKFQATIDDMIRENIKTKKITINNQEIEITI